MGIHSLDSDYSEFVEVDPTGRCGRYDEVLGKGASKIVYRAFDEYEGMEVAWNQVKLSDFLQSPVDLERLYCEIHLLKTLNHKNIMKFYASWVDLSKSNINFVTEMFTSGSLRQYRQMHRRVHIRAVKHWCRQILMGLAYLHSHDPPIIHRDLKCDNIFVNGNQGEVKIGDLGLAAILCKSHAVHCVGTPEFMAPEVYEEEYNELVDIYSFGMCVLEMVTLEYPYSECTHPAQIYKKVVSGAKPDALYRVKDPAVRQFIEKCLATVSRRLSARELLMDPFLQTDGLGSGCWERDIADGECISRQQPCYSLHHTNGCLVRNGSSDDLQQESEMDNDWEDKSAYREKHRIELFNSDEEEDEDELSTDVHLTIKGRKGDAGAIFIRLKIGDKEGPVRNIYFPFDTYTDTALGVAAEMIDELNIANHEVTRIAEMIDGEVSSLVPEWNSSSTPQEETSSYSDRGSNSSLYGSHHHHHHLTMIRSCSRKRSEVHGRFEEIAYQAEGSEQSLMERALVLSDGIEVTSQGSEESNCNEDRDNVAQVINIASASQNDTIQSLLQKQISVRRSDVYEDKIENKIPRDPRWMRLMYQLRVNSIRKRLLGRRRHVSLPLDPDKDAIAGVDKVEGSKISKETKSFHLSKRFSFRRLDVGSREPGEDLKVSKIRKAVFGSRENEGKEKKRKGKVVFHCLVRERIREKIKEKESKRKYIKFFFFLFFLKRSRK